MLERAVKVEMEGSAAGSGHSVKQCQSTASCILSQCMQEPKGLLQFQPFKERYKPVELQVQVSSAWP